MPYTLTRGPLLTLVENALNPTDAAGRAQRDDVLAALRAGTALDAVPWVTSADVAAVALPQASLDVRLRDDWFGRGDPPTKATTGYWVGYQGEVEPVLREGLIRAVEVSLGIANGAPPTEAPRAWPVEVQWKCPNPWFEVWVTWREQGPGPRDGRVTLLIATPPDTSNRLVTDVRMPPPPANGPHTVPVPLDEPSTADEAQGMWVVSHERHVPHVVDALVDTRSNEVVGQVDNSPGRAVDQVPLHVLPLDQWAVPPPGTVWVDDGPVVVVAPPPYAGGADPARSNAPDVR
jgi:hypothetical protein